MSATALRVVATLPLQSLLQACDAMPGHASPLLYFLHGYDGAAPLEIVVALTRHGPLWATPPASSLAPW